MPARSRERTKSGRDRLTKNFEPPATPSGIRRPFRDRDHIEGIGVFGRDRDRPEEPELATARNPTYLHDRTKRSKKKIGFASKPR